MYQVRNRSYHYFKKWLRVDHVSKSVTNNLLNTSAVRYGSIPSPKSMRFEITQCFKTFDKNFNQFKHIEIVKNDSNQNKSSVFLFPGFEGKMKYVEELIRNLNRTVYCFQYPFEKASSTVSILADTIHPLINEYIHPNETVNIIGHSFGGLVALDIIQRLELENKNIRLCLTESTPYALRTMTAASFGNINDRDQFENNFLITFLKGMKIDDVEQYRSILEKSPNWEIKVKNLLEKMPECKNFSKTNLYTMVKASMNTMKAVLLYDDNFDKLNAEAVLIQSCTKVLPFPDDFRETKYFKKPVKILYTDGNHFNMLKFEKTAHLINETFDTEAVQVS